MTGQGGLLPHPPPHFFNVAVVCNQTGDVMRQRAIMQRALWKSRLTVVTACLIAGAAGAAVVRTDLLLGRGLGTALQQSRSELSFGNFEVASRTGTTVGDEGYWLTRASVDNSSPFAKPPLIGDRISIFSADGEGRQFEVTALKALGPDGVAAADGNLAASRLLLVICRLLDGSGRDQRFVRFIVEMAPPEAAPPVQAKAL